ncbi:MAG: hypothetical protein ACR2GZ_09550 [Solirubrobacteraceae bacterium]
MAARDPAGTPGDPFGAAGEPAGTRRRGLDAVDPSRAHGIRFLAAFFASEARS